MITESSSPLEPQGFEQLLARITSDPGQMHGKPVIRGLRYPVETILELLASGMTTDEILADYADLEADDILACLAFAWKLSLLQSFSVAN